MQAMRAAPEFGQQSTLVTDYVSPEGATVTHVKATVCVASIRLLKQAGLYERYLGQLPAIHRDSLIFALASSWLPLALVMAHCHACDAMALRDDELSQHGELIAKQVGDSMLSVISRSVRSMGVQNAWLYAKQTDRLWPRTYRGGGATLIQTGPKDLIFEVHGLPMMTSRFYRASHHGYMKGFARMFSTAHFVKAVRPREPHPHRAATAISWV